MPAGIEGLPAVDQERATEQALTPAQIGASILLELGVGYDVSGIRVVGPKPECNATIADLVGIENSGHSEIRDGIIRVAKKAKERGEDPNEAVTEKIELFIQKDGAGQIMRVDPDLLKKK